MKIKSLLTILFLIVISPLCADIMASCFEPTDFEENEYVIYLFDNLEQQEPDDDVSQHYNFSFKDRDKRYEVRYTMFNQTAEVANVEFSVGSWSMSVSLNIIQSEELFRGFSPFELDDVMTEFNADYGLTTFAKADQSDWTNEYAYMLINFYFKEGVGIMCQTLLLNDLKVLQSQEFLDVFHSFKFL